MGFRFLIAIKIDQHEHFRVIQTSVAGAQREEAPALPVAGLVSSIGPLTITTSSFRFRATSGTGRRSSPLSFMGSNAQTQMISCV
jgi:hypothetical protein